MALTLDRRQLLSGLALGCSAAASPLLTPVTFAQAPWDNRLIVIILRGGMDGLDAVRPVGDPDFAALRPDLADGSLPLGSGFYAAHPSLERLAPLWERGELSFVHAVSTPYRDKRSHFDGQDILEAGIGGLDEGLRDGWLNRLLQIAPGVTAETAYAIGREQMMILRGEAVTGSWSPRTRLRLSPQAERLLEVVYHDDPLFRDASARAIEIAAETNDPDAREETREMLEENEMMAGVKLGGGHVQIAEFAASRLRDETRIASFSLNGWDTHNNQVVGLRQALSRLSDTILTLRAGLGADVWGKTAIVCLTEFGRTARQNGTKGTDHGTGGAMVLAGGAVRGGQVVGDWPGLSEADLYAGRDLMPTRDVRAHAGWIMRGLFGLSIGQVEQAIFPGAELGSDPGLLL